MNFKKTRKVISKLNTLMDSFESIGEELSDIEISLLETYIDEIKASLPTPKVAVEERIIESASKLSKGSQDDEDTPKTQVFLKKTQEDSVQPNTTFIKTEESTLETKVTEAAEIDSLDEVIVATDENTPNSYKKEQSQTITEALNRNLDALFTKIEVKDLSDRLKWNPIEDIDKSLSINERILTKNELFDGDAELMNATIATLNSLKSYDDAITYLKNNIALKLDWTSDAKKGKAFQFLQKVQRRYMNNTKK